MAAPDGFDYGWAISTGGALNNAQKRALFAPLLRTVAGYPGLRLRIALGRRGSGGFDLDAVRLPDSRLAREAQDLARESLSPFLLNHSYRVYFFGLALARLDAVEVDEEVTFVASMLHDLNLEHPSPGRCFALAGAQRAETFALEKGTSAERARRIGAEVCGHITAGGYENLAEEGGFVGAGAVCDLLGLRLDELDPAWVLDVLRRQPRHDFKRKLCEVWRDESRSAPDGRAHWLRRYAMLPALVRIAPLP